ncbi:hemagglutinin repeat-containing protein [Phyllobacterium sp. LjRoot231]|uniref:hemagglutinin repeat-containing protein n=1 Tax=Phyllobacterium sp. LjRoot231 TaxID=3342289 RepID=UPI003ED0E3E2
MFRDFSLAIGTFAVVATTGIACAQDTPAAPAQPQQASEPQVRSIQYQDWFYRCVDVKTADGKTVPNCEVAQIAQVKQGDKDVNVLTLAIAQTSPDSAKKDKKQAPDLLLTALVPLNVFLPSGFMIDADGTLAASNNLTLQGASVDVAGNAALGGKNITLDIVKVDNAGSQNATGAKVTTGGSLSIAANDNVNIIGSAAKAGASLDVTAENGSVNVVTTDITRKTDDGYSKTVAITQQQSQLSSGTGTTITAGDDVLLSGSSVDAGGNVKLSAGDDINIAAAQEQADTRFGKNSSSATTHIGSEIKAGGSISVDAGNGAIDGDHDLNIIGSKLDAGEKVQLKASDDITIVEALDTKTLDLQQKKKSGGLFGGSRKWTTHVETETAIGSSIIRRDTLDTNTSLPGIPDLQNVLAEQYQTQADYQAAAATLANVIGNIANKLAEDALKRGDTQAAEFWGADGVGRAAMHALGGALLGGVNDVAGVIKGAIGGAISTLAAPEIRKIVASIVNGTKLAGTDQGEFLINSVTSSLVQGIAAAAGGGDAAAYAGHEFKYNYLTHRQLEKQLEEMKECKDKSCIAEVEKKYFAIDLAQDNEVAACETVACAQFHLAAIEEAKKFLAEGGYLEELGQYSFSAETRIAANQFEGMSPAEVAANAALVDGAYCERNSGDHCKILSRIHEAVHEGATALVLGKILNVAIEFLSPAEVAAVRSGLLPVS